MCVEIKYLTVFPKMFLLYIQWVQHKIPDNSITFL